MSGYTHNGLVAGLGLRKLSDSVVPHVVETQAVSRAFDLADIGSALFVSALLPGLLQFAAFRTIYRSRQIAPRRPPSRHWFGGIGSNQAFGVRKNVPLLVRLRAKQQLGALP